MPPSPAHKLYNLHVTSGLLLIYAAARVIYFLLKYFFNLKTVYFIPDEV